MYCCDDDDDDDRTCVCVVLVAANLTRDDVSSDVRPGAAAVQHETSVLHKRVVACQSHVMIITSLVDTT